jgi:multiple sugar transport system substrate-binding protein
VDNSDLDRLIARTREDQLSRRRFLRLSGGAVGLAALAPIAAACAGPSASPTGGASPTLASAGPTVAALEPPGTKVSLDFWNPFTGPDGNFMKTLVDQFNQETPNVQIKVTTQGDYYTKVRAAAQAKRLPHVMIIHLDQIPSHAGDGLITPLDDLIALLGFEASDFTEAVWNQGEWKGSRFGIPLDIHTVTFYWNKDLFQKAGLDPEKPPATRDEFINAAHEITGKANVPGYIQINTNNFLAGILWATYFYQAGGEWTNEDFSQLTYNTDAGVQAADFMAQLYNDAQISRKGIAGDAEIAAFKAGQNGMVMSGIWETTGYAGALRDNLGAGPVPKFFGDGVWAGDHNFAVPNREGLTQDERTGAYYFIKWISDHSVEWAKAGQIPARKEVRDSAEFKAVPYISEIGAQADAARFFPPVPAAASWLFDAGGAGEAALFTVTGKQQAKAALDASVAKYQKILEENKKKYGF